MPEPTEKHRAVSSVRIFVWGCECKLWGGSDPECSCWCGCCEDTCHHYYSRETAEAFKEECWDGKATCDECGQPPTVREFLEEDPSHNLALIAAAEERGRRKGLEEAAADFDATRERVLAMVNEPEWCEETREALRGDAEMWGKASLRARSLIGGDK